MNDDLGISITEALNDMAECAFQKVESNQSKDAAAILSEWTTESHQCILTHHFLESVETVTDLMMYSFVDEGNFGYGTFSFDPDAELVD